MMNGLTKENVLVARQRRYWMRVRNSGGPKILTEFDLTVMGAKPITVRSSLNIYAQ
jgi:hypothetical protein